MADEPTERDLLLRACQELKSIREVLSRTAFNEHEAEGEIHEKMRRFVTYMHCMHDIGYMYEERGLDVPPWIKEELQRCDDRLRQLLTEAHTEGNTFEMVRRQMAADPLNRWDHTRQLEKKGNAA